MSMTAEDLTQALRWVAGDIGELAAQARDAEDAQGIAISEELDEIAVQVNDIADEFTGITAEEAYSLFNCMSPEDFVDKMGAASVYSAAVAREEASRLMCELLRKLGYGGGVRIFENLIM